MLIPPCWLHAELNGTVLPTAPWQFQHLVERSQACQAACGQVDLSESLK